MIFFFKYRINVFHSFLLPKVQVVKFGWKTVLFFLLKLNITIWLLASDIIHTIQDWYKNRYLTFFAIKKNKKLRVLNYSLVHCSPYFWGVDSYFYYLRTILMRILSRACVKIQWIYSHTHIHTKPHKNT